MAGTAFCDALTCLVRKTKASARLLAPDPTPSPGRQRERGTTRDCQPRNPRVGTHDEAGDRVVARELSAARRYRSRRPTTAQWWRCGRDDERLGEFCGLACYRGCTTALRGMSTNHRLQQGCTERLCRAHSSRTSVRQPARLESVDARPTATKTRADTPPYSPSPSPSPPASRE